GPGPHLDTSFATISCLDDVIDNATAEEPGCRMPCGCGCMPGLAAPTTPVQPYSGPDFKPDSCQWCSCSQSTPKRVDEGSLAACTQLTALRSSRWLPALTQLTQLQQLKVNQDLASDSLSLLATLPQLTDLRLRSCPLQPSSQLSRFLFQHLTYLSVSSIHSRDLAALDCPQLQTLAVDHLQEFKAAAAGDGVRQLGLPPSASALLEALAPWQPRSGKAIEMLGLCHLSDVTREALEWLPVNIKSLKF
ncbi:hypothetical protein HaLaN_28191, partial [Haematococcus lacustris]